MTGLLRAEVRRLTSRRIARVYGALFLGGILLVQVIAFFRSNHSEAAALNGTLFRAAEVLEEMAGGVAGTAALVSFIVGASYIGAEWGAGTMQALLFWEPRRHRVILAKAAALVGVMVVFTAVMQAVGWSTTMLVGSTRGTTDGVTSAIQSDAFGTMLRGLFVVAFTGLLGFAIAGFARVTGAALGVGFLYFAIVEQVIAGLRPGWISYLISPNVAAVMADGIEDDRGSRIVELTAGRGIAVLLVYLVLFVGAFSVAFDRRDVT